MVATFCGIIFFENPFTGRITDCQLQYKAPIYDPSDTSHHVASLSQYLYAAQELFIGGDPIDYPVGQHKIIKKYLKNRADLLAKDFIG
jgi:hypothetical protein